MEYPAMIWPAPGSPSQIVERQRRPGRSVTRSLCLHKRPQVQPHPMSTDTPRDVSSAPAPSCIVKLGGSLLDLPNLPDLLESLLLDFSRPRPILLVGGGDTVDLIRKWDRLYGLGEEAAHWISVRALSINALVVERAVPRTRVTTRVSLLEEIWASGKVPILDPYAFLQAVDEESASPLPRRWRVTTDSIGARMATALGAPELVLLKSISIPDGTTRAEATRRGWVDLH